MSRSVCTNRSSMLSKRSPCVSPCVLGLGVLGLGVLGLGVLGLGVLGLAFIGVRQHPARVAPSRSQSATCEGSAGSDTINHRSRHGVLEVLEQELELAA